MDDIPDFIFYIFLIIFIIILFLFILKYNFNWTFKINIGKFEHFDNNKNKVINDVVKNVEQQINKIDNEDKLNNELKTDNNDISNKKENSDIKEKPNDEINKETKKTIEEIIDEKVKEKLNELQKQNEIIERNDGEKIIKKHHYPYSVMLNEPIGRMKQSKLMIDQLVSKNLDRYYAYVKPIIYEEKSTPYNENTFCIKCDSKDQEYSSYFYSDPLEYQNDKLDENKNEAIKAYNV